MNNNIPPGWSIAEPWSLWTGEIGRLLVLAAIGLFVIAALSTLLQAKKPKLAKLGTLCFWLGTLCLFGAITSLGILFANNQFQYEYVRARADIDTDLKYKIAGIWAGQQGSFMLWACCSALFGVLTLKATGIYRRWYLFAYAIFLAALSGIIAYETPFLVNFIEGQAVIPPTGDGLTPSLQNYWVVIHPPTIFMGFGSLAVLFCWAVSAMLTGNLKDWIHGVRPWTLVSLSLLGLGLCMGGFWAYETLGWGGFWAWDPVENVSFVPWVLLAALLHGTIVQVNKGRWLSANALLAGIPFLTFVYGTFLTRSGFLSEVSVHSFAEMDRSALMILLGLLIFSLLAFVILWATKGRSLAKAQDTPTTEEAAVTRVKAYQSGVLLLCGLSIAVAIGMSVPFFMALAGQTTKVVEEHLYHQVVVWFFIPIIVLMGVGPFISWRSMGMKALLGRIFNVFAVSFGLVGISMLVIRHPEIGVGLKGGETIAFPFGIQVSLLVWILTLFFFCAFAATANLLKIFEATRYLRPSLGGFLAHFGLAILMAGLILSRGFERKERVFIRGGDMERVLEYAVKFRGQTSALDYRNNKAVFDVINLKESFKNRDINSVRSFDDLPARFEARPGLYELPSQDGQTNFMTWPHIERQASHDLYFALASPILEVWPEATAFAPGESRTIQGIKVTYLEMTREGEAGQMGTKFGAKLRFDIDGQTFSAHPKIMMTELGLRPELSPVNDDFFVSMLGMEARDRSAFLQMYFAQPIYPVELFYKPMTTLVWLGTSILTFGGLLAAFQRRRRNNPE